MRVAYLGPAGTHSEEALRASAPPGIEEVPYPTIYDAVMAVHDGTVDTAIVPIENALEGSVAVTLDTLALEAGDVRIAAEVVHPIHHCAIAPSELALSQVERVVSHPQATA
jgi:prephenate dehydratase